MRTNRRYEMHRDKHRKAECCPSHSCNFATEAFVHHTSCEKAADYNQEQQIRHAHEEVGTRNVAVTLPSCVSFDD